MRATITLRRPVRVGVHSAITLEGEVTEMPADREWKCWPTIVTTREEYMAEVKSTTGRPIVLYIPYANVDGVAFGG
jgi:hypothetical protein